MTTHIYLNSEKEIDLIARAARTTAAVLDELWKMVRPGLATIELDRAAGALMKQHGVRAAFKGYRGYPARVCVSIDDEVVHGIPSAKRICAAGQIVSIDIGVAQGGFYGDMALSVPVGEVTDERTRLLRTTQEALRDAIAACRVGNRLGDVSAAIQRRAEGAGFSVVRDYVGHGIGRQMHEEPQIPNYGSPGTGVRLAAGMIFAIEPMVNEGGAGVRVLDDGWTVVTADRRPSAHFEKMVAVTDSGPRVLAETDFI